MFRYLCLCAMKYVIMFPNVSCVLSHRSFASEKLREVGLTSYDSVLSNYYYRTVSCSYDVVSIQASGSSLSLSNVR